MCVYAYLCRAFPTLLCATLRAWSGIAGLGVESLNPSGFCVRFHYTPKRGNSTQVSHTEINTAGQFTPAVTPNGKSITSIESGGTVCAQRLPAMETADSVG
jgi:hypothetical protein